MRGVIILVLLLTYCFWFWCGFLSSSEWFFVLSRELFNPRYDLFRFAGSRHLLEVNPDSHVVPDHLAYFRFAGRVLGLAVRHAHYLDGGFVPPLYKLLLDRDVSLEDLEGVDPALHSSLMWFQTHDITGVLDDATFVDSRSAFGQVETIELLPGGATMTVTEANKHEYVRLLVRQRLVAGIMAQVVAFRAGFNDVAPAEFLDVFDARELELMLSGLGAVDVADWRAHTDYRHCDAHHPVVVWFWRYVERCDTEHRTRLLQFVTGTSRVPVTGFADLQVG